MVTYLTLSQQFKDINNKTQKKDATYSPAGKSVTGWAAIHYFEYLKEN